VELTTHVHILPRSRKVELYLHCPICLHGIVLNKLSTGTALPYTCLGFPGIIHNSVELRLPVCLTESSEFTYHIQHQFYLMCISEFWTAFVILWVTLIHLSVKYLHKMCGIINSTLVYNVLLVFITSFCLVLKYWLKHHYF
jgi:hypothetical protein